MWQYEYDSNNDETTIYWDGEEQANIAREISRWQNGYPANEEAREAIGEAIQSAGTPDRIRMQFDFNYGFEEISPDDEE